MSEAGNLTDLVAENEILKRENQQLKENETLLRDLKNEISALHDKVSNEVNKSDIEKRLDQIKQWEISKDGRNLMMEEIFRAKYGISVATKIKPPNQRHRNKHYLEYGSQNSNFCKLMLVVLLLIS